MTISGYTETNKNKNNTTITASQTGDANYGAAAPEDQPQTEKTTAQTITFAALGGKTNGDEALTLTATDS